MVIVEEHQLILSARTLLTNCSRNMLCSRLSNVCRLRFSAVGWTNLPINHGVNWLIATNLNAASVEVIKNFHLTRILNACSSANLSRSFSTLQEGMDQILQEKATLREGIKKKIAELTSEEKQRQSEVVKAKLFNHDVYKKSQRVSVFLNLDDEIQTLDILKDLLHKNKTVFIPRYSGKLGRMDMVKLNSWEDYESLPVTRWNIKQPSINDARENALETGGLDLTIMPGLAFTENGHRLGRGKGYYDAFLTRASLQAGKPYTIAVAFKQQVLPRIPVTPSDVLIDEVLFDDQ